MPAIGVDANIQDVGLADDGSMGVPVGYDDIAYYTLSVSPGFGLLRFHRPHFVHLLSRRLLSH